MFKRKEKPTHDIYIEWLDGKTEVIRNIECYSTVCGNVVINFMKPRINYKTKDMSYILGNGAFKKVTRWEHIDE